MKATFAKNPTVIECQVVFRHDPYIRPLDREHVFIMQRITYIHEGKKHYTDVILEKAKKVNAITRYRYNQTRTKNARAAKKLGVYKLEVAS